MLMQTIRSTTLADVQYPKHIGCIRALPLAANILSQVPDQKPLHTPLMHSPKLKEIGWQLGLELPRKVFKIFQTIF
jgi:hypothetical protein